MQVRQVQLYHIRACRLMHYDWESYTPSYLHIQANALQLRVLRTVIPTYSGLTYMFDLNKTLYMCGYSFNAHAQANQGYCTDINISFSLHNYWILQPHLFTDKITQILQKTTYKEPECLKKEFLANLTHNHYYDLRGWIKGTACALYPVYK